VHFIIHEEFNQYAQSMFNNDLSFRRYVLIADRWEREVACELGDNLTCYTNLWIYSVINEYVRISEGAIEKYCELVLLKRV